MTLRSIPILTVKTAHAHVAMLARLANLKPPLVTGSRADPIDCQNLADHLQSVADILSEYVADALADFDQYAPCGAGLTEDADEFAGYVHAAVADCITGPLLKQADALAEE